MAARRFDEVLVETASERLRAAALIDAQLVDWMDEPCRSAFAAGSIVMGRVVGAAPELNAVFVDIGAGRPALLDLRREPPEQGAVLPVQIVESPSGDKGGRVTRRLALTGQQVVLLPGGKGIASSRRLDPAVAATLAKQIAPPAGFGVLLRWTAALAEADAIAVEIAQLAARWGEVSPVQAPGTVLIDDGDGLARVLRTFGAHGSPAFVFNDALTFRAAERLASRWFPGLAGRLSPGEAALFDRHDVASLAASAAERDLPLPGGGRIAIEPARACTAIDVDTAAGSQAPQAFLRTNLAAAREIARQLWLRDIGGVVVVDFIRMAKATERQLVLDTLAGLVAGDRVPVTVAGWTRSGLFELTRERARGGGAGA